MYSPFHTTLFPGETASPFTLGLLYPWSTLANGHTPGNSHPCSGVGVSGKTPEVFLKRATGTPWKRDLDGDSVKGARVTMGLKKKTRVSPGLYSTGDKRTVWKGLLCLANLAKTNPTLHGMAPSNPKEFVVYFKGLKLSYRIDKDAKCNCLVLVWKPIDQEFTLEPFFSPWKISLWNGVIFKQTVSAKKIKKIKNCHSWLGKCVYPVFFKNTISPDSHNGLSPDFHRFFFISCTIVDRTKHEHHIL